ALAEIEDYQRVTFGAVHDVSVVAPLVPDLVLVFAELLENATSFSPPQSTVEIHAATTVAGWCQIGIVDHGIGMNAERLAEENRRLVERERLDIVPTSVLGLFVVGRLARRHGLAVELLATPGGGTTAVGALPPGLDTARGAEPARPVEPPPLTRRTPGANLAPGLRDAPSGAPTRRPAVAQQRDPEADRAAFDGFATGLAAAADRQRTTTTESTQEGSG